MTLGLQGVTSGRIAVYRLIEGAGASGIAAPSLATDGIDLAAIAGVFDFEDVAAIRIWKTAGSSLSIASARVAGYGIDAAGGNSPSGWGPMGTGSATLRGELNGGAAIAEVTGYTTAPAILLLQEVDGLHYVDRIAVELGAITGSSPAVNVDLILSRRRKRA